MNSSMAASPSLIVLGLILGIAGLVGVTIFHYKSFSLISRYYVSRPFKLGSFVFTMCAALMIHTVEIVNFAILMVVAEWLGVGTITGARESYFFDYVYYSAITYTSVGYGDISPTGGMRILAAMTALAGLMLVALSGAFLSSLLQRHDENISAAKHNEKHQKHLRLMHFRRGVNEGLRDYALHHARKTSSSSPKEPPDPSTES